MQLTGSAGSPLASLTSWVETECPSCGGPSTRCTCTYFCGCGGDCGGVVVILTIMWVPPPPLTRVTCVCRSMPRCASCAVRAALCELRCAPRNGLSSSHDGYRFDAKYRFQARTRWIPSWIRRGILVLGLILTLFSLLLLD